MSSRCTSSPAGKIKNCIFTRSYFACLAQNSPLKQELGVVVLQTYFCWQAPDCFTHLSMIKDWCQSFTQMHPSFSSIETFSSGKCPVRLLHFQFIFMKKCSSGSNKGLNNIYLPLLSLVRRGGDGPNVPPSVLSASSIGTFKRAPGHA